MANPEHVERLLAGVETWNEWRRENPGVSVDLHWVGFSEANLSKANLSKANLSGAYLSKADLREASLSGADLSGVILTEAHLRRVLRQYVPYFNEARPHQGLAQRVPALPARLEGVPPASGTISAVPVLGGLHHAYQRAA